MAAGQEHDLAVRHRQGRVASSPPMVSVPASIGTRNMSRLWKKDLPAAPAKVTVPQNRRGCCPPSSWRRRRRSRRARCRCSWNCRRRILEFDQDGIALGMADDVFLDMGEALRQHVDLAAMDGIDVFLAVGRGDFQHGLDQFDAEKVARDGDACRWTCRADRSRPTPCRDSLSRIWVAPGRGNADTNVYLPTISAPPDGAESAAIAAANCINFTLSHLHPSH